MRQSGYGLNQLLDRLREERCDLTDGVLLVRYAEGDQLAFNTLMKRHGPMVYGTARRIAGDSHVAEDLFQATFLILARKATAVRWDDSIAGWLHRVVRRLAIRNAAAPKPLPEPLLESNNDPLAQLTAREWLRAIEEELSNLPARYREVLLLCGVEELSRQEAAGRLGWSIGAVKGRLERGRELLRQRLRKRGFADMLGVGGLLFGAGVAPARELLQRTQQAALHPQTVPGAVAALVEKGLASSFFCKAFTAVAMMLVATALGIGSMLLVTEDPPKEQPAVPAWKNPAVEYALKDDYPLPERAEFRIGTRKFRAEGWIGPAILTPDGKQILTLSETDLSGSPTLGLTIMDLRTGLPVRKFEESKLVCKPGGWEIPPPMAFSPDGKILYGLIKDPGDDNQPDWFWGSPDNPMKRQLRLWDAATGKILSTHDLPRQVEGRDLGSSLLSVHVSADGKRLYVGGSVRMRTEKEDGGTIYGVAGMIVYDAKTMEPTATWNGAGWYVGTSPDGKSVVAFDRHGISIHDAASGKVLRHIPGGGETGNAVLSPDRKRVASVTAFERKTGDKKETPTLRVWDVESGELLAAIDPKHSAYWNKLCFGPDGKIIYLSDPNGGFQEWDWQAAKMVRGWKGHAGRISALFQTPGGDELVSAGHDGVVRRWATKTVQSLTDADPFRGRSGFALSPNGRLLAIADSGGRLEVWDVAEKRLLQKMTTRGTNEHELAFSPDNKLLLVAAMYGKSGICDWERKEWVHDLPPAPRELMQEHGESSWGSVRFTPDGKHLIASKHWLGTWMWEIGSWKKVWHVKEIEGGPYTPDRKRILTGEWHSKPKLRDPMTGEVRQEINLDGMSDGVFINNGRQVILSDINRAIRVVDLSKNQVVLDTPYPERIYCLDLSPSGRLLAIGTERGIRVMEVVSWKEVARLDGHLGSIRFLQFLGDGKLLSGCSEDGTALIWNLKPKKIEPLEPARAWTDLQGEAVAAEKAIWSLVQNPKEAVSLFKSKYPLPKPIDPEKLRSLIRDLDSAQFKKREDAAAELTRLGGPIRGKLREALNENPSPEMRERLTRIVDQIAPASDLNYSPEERREWRSVWVLEQIGTPDAGDLLRDWAKNSMGLKLSELAAGAEKRLQSGRGEGK